VTRKKMRRPYRPTLQPVTSIIVPVLGEADNILPLVKRLRRAVVRRKIEVLFVVDGPDNKTVGKVKLAKTTYRSKTFDVRFYHRKGNNRWGGLSGSVIDGMARAKSDRIIIMDGDLQHPPETIPDVITASKRGDVVIASRYCKGGSASGLGGSIRHIVSRGSTLLAKILFPIRMHKVSDPMTGFFLVNRGKVDISKLRPKGLKILLEILATHPKLTVIEVPLQFAYRVTGKSHSTLGRGLEFLSQLIRLRFGRLPKYIQFAVIGGSVFGFGMGLLYMMVEMLGWPPLAANAIQLAITFWLNYFLNRKITWHERNVSRLAAHKFLTSRAATTVLNYMLFAWLISQQYSFTIFGQAVNFSISYLVANIITLVAVMVLNYIFSDRWAFAEPKQKKTTLNPFRRFSSYIPPGAYKVALLIGLIDLFFVFNPILTLSIILALASLFLFVQSCLEVWRIVYTYREPDGIDRLRFPVPREPRENFCIIVPARHESAVLASTLRQLARQTHPNVSIITVICDDDYDTLSVAYDIESDEPRVEVISYPMQPDIKPSKPKQLNYVFNQIKGRNFTVIGVVDAEDTVHQELLIHIDAAFRDRKTGVVQGGVQLMNHDSSWYSLHNVLEYYRWFSSAMKFQADNKFMPLGGNTVFIREKLLRRAEGWPETLTEDCSLGVLLSTLYQTKVAVYYEPWLTTLEETPGSLMGLFKQRVRWNQGFFQEWRKGVWRELPSFRQRLLADYVLLNPILLATISLLIPVSLLAILFLDAPVGLVMLMYLSLVPASVHLVLNAVLLRDFGMAFGRKIRLRHYAILITTQIPYQIVLNTAALWAVFRELRGERSWYKTAHIAKHRSEPAYEAIEASGINLVEESSDV